MTFYPCGISFSDLEKLAKDAPEEKAPELTFEQEVINCANRHLDIAADEIGDPMVHKEMFLEICRRMIQWHTTIGDQLFEKGEPEAGTCWLRDAGKFQAAMTIVSASRLDLTTHLDDPLALTRFFVYFIIFFKRPIPIQPHIAVVCPTPRWLKEYGDFSHDPSSELQITSRVVQFNSAVVSLLVGQLKERSDRYRSLGCFTELYFDKKLGRPRLHVRV